MGEFWDEFPEHRGLIRILVENEIQLPTFGAEIGSERYGVDMTWESALVTVVGSPDDYRDASLEDDGWTVLSSDMDPQDVADTIIRELA